jgi:crossover junction endonuclease MUS81
MRLLVDGREGKIKEMVNYDLNITLTNLDIGDFVFKDDADETLLLIERKTLSDLSSSIKTGRYREQKKRILSSVPKEKVIYLIEGRLDEPKTKSSKFSKYGLPISTLISSTINLILRDNIKVIFTKDLEDTFRWLEMIYNKIEDKLILNSKKNEGEEKMEYLECLKTVKKDNITKDNCYILQLSQIPGVSVKIATAIATKYPSFKKILEAYNEINDSDESEKEKLLADIKVNDNRKLGKVLSARLYQYLYK